MDTPFGTTRHVYNCGYNKIPLASSGFYSIPLGNLSLKPSRLTIHRKITANALLTGVKSCRSALIKCQNHFME